VADETELQHLPNQDSTALVLSEARSSLIARARKDAISLMVPRPESISLVAFESEQKSVIADSDDAEEQFNLGKKYFDADDIDGDDFGDSLEESFAKAAICWHKAAKRGHGEAQRCLGHLYEYGYGVPRDYAQAEFWYRKAIEQGNVDAQCNLGHLFEDGNGVAQDYAQAEFWYRKAAEQGCAWAQSSLGSLYYSGDGIPRNYAQAATWWRKSAEQGFSYAQNSLACLYEDGQGIAQDYSRAYFWRYVSALGEMLSSRHDIEHEAEFRLQEIRAEAAEALTPAELFEVENEAYKWFDTHATRQD
jgi:TPR repeat protein